MDDDHPTVLPFDYATVGIRYGNLVVLVTRGRGEVNLSIGPQSRAKLYPIETIAAALFSQQEKSTTINGSFDQVSAMLRDRIGWLDEQFSSQNFPEIERKLRG